MMKKSAILTIQFWRLYRAMSASIVEAFCFKYAILNFFARVITFPLVIELTGLGYRLEQQIAHDGHLQRASQWLIRLATDRFCVHHVENIPSTRPLLFVGNHAGLGDANTVYASAPRTDIHTLVFNRGLLLGLPEVQHHMIEIDEDNPTQALRESLRHLQAGHAILMFPRGKIEDDPSLYLDSALASLNDWSASIEFFVKHVPGLQVIPFAVGGVISRTALNNPIVRQYKNHNHRHFLAATFQLLLPYYRDPVVSLHYGEVLTDKSATLANIQAQMRYLLRQIHTEQAALFAD